MKQKHDNHRKTEKIDRTDKHTSKETDKQDVNDTKVVNRVAVSDVLNTGAFWIGRSFF